jgi:hypothetical protein
LKRRKIYYVPGLISLLGLPLLVFFFTPEVKPKNTVLRFFLPLEQSPKNEGPAVFSKESIYGSIKMKKIIAVDLDQEFFSMPNDKYLFNAKRRFIVREMERMQFTHDTTAVLKIDIGESNSLGTFVWIINQTIFYNVNRWAFMDNSFYLQGNAPKPKTAPIDLILPSI